MEKECIYCSQEISNWAKIKQCTISADELSWNNIFRFLDNQHLKHLSSQIILVFLLKKLVIANYIFCLLPKNSYFSWPQFLHTLGPSFYFPCSVAKPGPKQTYLSSLFLLCLSLFACYMVSFSHFPFTTLSSIYSTPYSLVPHKYTYISTQVLLASLQSMPNYLRKMHVPLSIPLMN